MIRSLPISLLVTTAIMAVAAPAANAAAYIKFDGVQGTVAVASQEGQSPIEVRWLELPTAAKDGRSATIGLKRSTPLLDRALAGGAPIDELELTFRAPVTQARGSDQQSYLTVTLEDVLVSSYQASAQEIRLSLNFTKVTYVSHAAPGSGTPQTMSAEALASTLARAAGANFALADGSVRFIS